MAVRSQARTVKQPHVPTGIMARSLLLVLSGVVRRCEKGDYRMSMMKGPQKVFSQKTYWKVGALTIAALAAYAGSSLANQNDGFVTSVKPYVKSIVPEYSVKPILSVGDRVPETSNPSLQYQMVGIPDGLGAYKSGGGKVTLYMNHEFTQVVQSEPTVGQPLNRGAFVSKYILTKNGTVLSGERAYDEVYLENTLIGPAAQVDNSTPGFARFCSGSLVGPWDGFEDIIYFANEESTGSATFDGKGGLSVAIIQNKAYGLPKLGHFSWENTLAAIWPKHKVVIMGMEDGPAALENQIWMYVGTKDKSRNATVLGRNGLDNGKLYVFRSLDLSKNSELTFQNGSITGEWIEIPNAGDLTDVQLEAAADAVNAFTMIRPEDGAFNKKHREHFYFVTTGGNRDQGNELGRLYDLELNPWDATKPAKLRVVYNADQIIAAGGDIAISPDNIDTSKDYLMINEDGTTQSRAVMTTKGRDGSVWRLKIKNDGTIDANSAVRVASLNPPGRDGAAVGPGVWETTGVIDAKKFYGKNTWLMNVQAHSPTVAPATNTVEDGQLALFSDVQAGDNDEDEEDDE